MHGLNPHADLLTILCSAALLTMSNRHPLASFPLNFLKRRKPGCFCLPQVGEMGGENLNRVDSRQGSMTTH